MSGLRVQPHTFLRQVRKRSGKIAELYRGGMTIAALSERFGVPRTTLRMILNEAANDNNRSKP